MKLEPYFFRPLNADGTFAPGWLPPGAEQPVMPEAPPAPTFSEEELKAAEDAGRQQGYLKGMEDGYAKAKAEHVQIDLELTEIVNQLTGQITDVLQQYHVFIAEQYRELPKLALAIAHKVAGAALEHDPSPMIEEMVQRSLKIVVGNPTLTVTVHPSVAEALEARLTASFAGNNDAGEVIILSDEALAPADCRITWENGGAERNTKGLWYEVESALIATMRDDGAPAIEAPQQDTTPPSSNEGNEGENHG